MIKELPKEAEETALSELFEMIGYTGEAEEQNLIFPSDFIEKKIHFHLEKTSFAYSNYFIRKLKNVLDYWMIMTK